MFLKESAFVKLRVAVPVEAAEAIRTVLSEQRAGVQGNYDSCSASYRQIGRFRPLKGANPTIGEVGKIEEVEEEMIETICHVERLKNVLDAVKKAHPYEEPVIDIFPRFDVQ